MIKKSFNTKGEVLEKENVLQSLLRILEKEYPDSIMLGKMFEEYKILTNLEKTIDEDVKASSQNGLTEDGYPVSP